MDKIPSALKWMMTRRARVLGEIKKAEKRFDTREALLIKELQQVQAREAKLRSRLQRVQDLRLRHLSHLNLDIRGIDNALGQHPILIDTELIQPLRGQDNAWLLPHGAMSRYILRALREANGEILCTQEIALFVAAEGRLTIDPEDFRSFKIAIRRRLRALNAAGMLKRVEVGRNTMDSRWVATNTIRVPGRRGRPPKPRQS